MPPFDLFLEHLVDELMLLNNGQAGEFGRGDIEGVHAAAAAGDVLDL